MTALSETVDIAIVGAGPAGLHAAFQAGQMGLSACLIDTLDFAGGQCTALYPEKPIYDIPGCPGILAADLIKNLEQQTKVFQPKFYLGQQVIEISKTPDGFVLHTIMKKSAHLNELRAKTIVIAAGSGAFTPNKPPIANIERYENKFVFYSVQHKDLFDNKDIVICGGGDSAVDWTLILSQTARSVTLVHRREVFRCMPDNLHRLQELRKIGKVKIAAPCQLADVQCSDDGRPCVYIKDGKGLSTQLSADAVLLFFGLTMNLGNMSDWGLQMDKKHLVVDHATMATNIQGIYAAGDICTYPGKLKLILAGFAEAAMACRSIYSYLNPTSHTYLQHSTSRPGMFTLSKTDTPT